MLVAGWVSSNNLLVAYKSKEQKLRTIRCRATCNSSLIFHTLNNLLYHPLGLRSVATTEDIKVIEDVIEIIDRFTLLIS